MFEETPAPGEIPRRILAAQGKMGLGYVFSNGKRILDVNEAACRITQYSRAELLAFHDPFVLLPPASRERLREDLAKRMARGASSWLTHTQLIRKDGTLASVEIGACYEIGDDRRPELLAVFRETGESTATVGLGSEAPTLPARVHEAIRGIIGAAQMGPSRLRTVGGSLAALADGGDLEQALRVYAEMGLGRLALVQHEDGHYRFRGEGLAEHSREKRTTTCYLALGYLTHAVERIVGRPAAGAEMSCVSRGDPTCEFEVRIR